MAGRKTLVFVDKLHSWTLGLLLATVACTAQVAITDPVPSAAVPKLVRFSGSFRPANGLPVQSVEGVTLAVYREQAGGEALWSEIQNVSVDADGHYSVLMGATRSDGMPVDLFSSGEPRWLGAQFNRPGEVEQPRVLLVSVPYALKASDAETLGGRPASAYLLAGAPLGTSTGLEHVAASSTTATTPASATKAAAPASSGIPNYIAMFVNSTDVGDSVMYQANGAIGVGTTQPAISLDVRTGALPQIGIAGTTDYLTFFASDTYGPAIYWDPAKDMRFGRGGTGLYNPYGFVEQMRIQSSTGNVGIGTLTPGSKLDVSGDVNLSGSIRLLGSPFLQMPGGLSRANTALGFGALASNTTGSRNTASGYQALQLNTTGSYNVATGSLALQNNTTANYNTASGDQALAFNTTGEENTAFGDETLFRNTIGNRNTATGAAALRQNTTGSFNTGVGYYPLQNNTTGSNNIAIGYEPAANVSGGNSNNIHIGSAGASGDSGAIRIGTPGTQTSFFVAGVNGVTITNSAVPVLIDTTNGQLGVTSSSRRYKEDIQDMGAASYDLMRLRPVTYRYKQPFADGSKPIQYGLIAEEVAEIYPDLVAHSADGQIETVKYQVLDSMLLNEVQRQQAEIGAQKKQIRKLEERLAQLGTQLEAVLGSMSNGPHL